MKIKKSLMELTTRVLGLGIVLFALNVMSGYAASMNEPPRDPSDPHKRAGFEYLEDGKFGLAIQEYEKALIQDPKSTASYFNLAIAYYSMKNIDGAMHALESLIAIDSNDAEALYNLACLKLYRHNYKDSKMHFEKARECCDENPEFKPLIEQGLEFLDEFQKLDSAVQDVYLFFLQASLPSQTFVS